MHFMFAWQCEEATPERMAELTNLFEACLGEHPRVNVMDRLYAVQVMGNGVYEAIQMQLVLFSKSQPETVKFMMSPLIHRGVYHGRLGKEAVEGLQQIVL